MHKIFALLMIFVLLTSGCTGGISNEKITGNAVVKDIYANKVVNNNIPAVISTLPLITEETIDTYEKYEKFADAANRLIDELEKTGDMEIPKLVKTREAYEQLAKKMTEYDPVIKDYNRVVLSAKKVDPSSQSSVNDFYAAAGIFGIKFGIIYVALFGATAYEIVGILYRSTGLQSWALRCSTCVSAVLESGHWFVRNGMVNISVDALEKALATISTMLVK